MPAEETSSNTTHRQPVIVELEDEYLFGEFDRPDLTLTWNGKPMQKYCTTKHIVLMNTILRKLDTDPDFEVTIRNSADRKAFMYQALMNEDQEDEDEEEEEEEEDKEEKTSEEGKKSENGKDDSRRAKETEEGGKQMESKEGDEENK